MSFDQDTFATVGAHSTPTPRVYSYESTDPIVTVISTGYFADKQFQLEEGDVILARLSGVLKMLNVTADASTAAESPIGKDYTDTFFIERLEDLVHDDTTVTFPAGTTCMFMTTVDIGDRIINCLGDCAAVGSSLVTSGISSDTTGTLLNSTGSVIVKNMQLTLTESTGTHLELDAAAGGVCIFEEVFFIGGIIGAARGYFATQFDKIRSFNQFGGLIINGTTNRLLISRFNAVNWLGTTNPWISFVGDITERAQIADSIFDTSSGEVVVFVDPGATFIGEGFRVLNNTFTGPGTYLSGIDANDDAAFFRGNKNLIDSIANAGWNMVGNSTATVISTTSTPVVMAGTTVLLTAQPVQKFTHIASPNKVTYTGAKSGPFLINAHFTMETVTNNQVLIGSFSLNGVQVPDSKIRLTTSGAAGTRIDNMVVSAVVSIDEDDDIQFLVENETSTDNITVTDGFFQVVALT